MSNGPARVLIEEVSLDSGKYRFRYNVDTYELVCWRYGQEWRTFVGDNAVFCLFQKALACSELEKEISRLKTEVENQRQRAAEWEDCYVALKKATGNESR